MGKESSLGGVVVELPPDVRSRNHRKESHDEEEDLVSVEGRVGREEAYTECHETSEDRGESVGPVCDPKKSEWSATSVAVEIELILTPDRDSETFCAKERWKSATVSDSPSKGSETETHAGKKRDQRRSAF